ncbi:MAG: hypothetical protein IPH45_19900 [Bacteroidales bacterium]|nr:hypothetical protein [Bacteroidales bacterium]
MKTTPLKIFFSEFIKTSGTSGWNFKYTGAVISFFSLPDISLLGTYRLPYYDVNNVCYGNAVMTENGYSYIYGRQETDTVTHVAYPHVARVPSGNLQAPWQFFNGSGWVNEPDASYRIGNVAVSQQYGFFKQDNKYVLLSQEIWLSSKIYSYTCVTPSGPLNNKVLLYQTPILYPVPLPTMHSRISSSPKTLNCWFLTIPMVISGRSLIMLRFTGPSSFVSHFP